MFACIKLLVIDDNEVCKLWVCLARMDSLEMGGGGGRVCNGMGGGEDTCMLGIGRSWTWGVGIG